MDPNAGNCGLFGAQAFGCNGDGDAQLAAGYLTFDATQGQACLDAFSAATTCDANAVNGLVMACSGIFRANVAVGGLCYADAQCIPPDGGAPFSELFGCDTYSNPTATCGGVCTYGHAIGELCQGGFNGSGCAEGQCVFTGFVDGGYANVCTASLAEGASCINTNAQCDGSVDYCDLATTGTCLPYAQDGGACDRYNCNYSQGCACVSGSFCQLDDATDAGYCAPAAADGGTCRVSDCDGVLGNCDCTGVGIVCVPPDDGGDLGACLPKQGVGSPCDLTNCPYGVACVCADNTVCAAVDGGGAQCSPKEGVGGPCVPNSCFDPTWVGCACDASQGLFCASNGTCQVQASEGGSCDPNAYPYASCTSGLICASGTCLSSNPGDGGLCAPNDGVYCSGSLVCTDPNQGFCVPPTPPANRGDACDPAVSGSCVSGYRCLAQDGGGGVCAALPGASELCDFSNNDQGCRLLLTCANESFTDGGSGAVCVDQNVIDGGACDPNGQSCINGYCEVNSLTCRPFLNVGDPCDNNQGSAQCGPKGYCGTNPDDGGFMCFDQCISGD
ncbi:MAG: hypothetical protein JST54_31395 [Deltaproteobacteria bacterium]|nr:hypothetical protein [Deltaproteobacteria bacterium]